MTADRMPTEHHPDPKLVEAYQRGYDFAMRCVAHARTLAPPGGYRLGYLHGWSDKKAGRQYGEGRTAFPAELLAELLAQAKLCADAAEEAQP